MTDYLEAQIEAEGWLLRRDGLTEYTKVFWSKDAVKVVLDLTGVERDMPASPTREEIMAAAKRRMRLQRNDVVNITYKVVSTEEGGVRT